MSKSQACQLFLRRGLTWPDRSLNCAMRYGSPCGSTVRLLGVSSLNSGRAQVRPFFFAQTPVGAGRLARQDPVRRIFRQPRDLAIDRREIGPRRREQLLEIVDEEVGLLIAVDVVLRPHDAP